MNYCCVELLSPEEREVYGQFVKFMRNDEGRFDFYRIIPSAWGDSNKDPTKLVTNNPKCYREVDCQQCKHKLVCLACKGAIKSFEQIQ